MKDVIIGFEAFLELLKIVRAGKEIDRF